MLRGANWYIMSDAHKKQALLSHSGRKSGGLRVEPFGWASVLHLWARENCIPVNIGEKTTMKGDAEISAENVAFCIFCAFVGFSCLDLSVECLELSVGCLELSFGCLELSSGCLELSVGCPACQLGVWIYLLGVWTCPLGVCICLWGVCICLLGVWICLWVAQQICEIRLILVTSAS